MVESDCAAFDFKFSVGTVSWQLKSMLVVHRRIWNRHKLMSIMHIRINMLQCFTAKRISREYSVLQSPSWKWKAPSCQHITHLLLFSVSVSLFALVSVSHHLQMRTLLQIWSQKNPVQELRIVPTNLEESLCPREQCVRQRPTWKYVH